MSQTMIAKIAAAVAGFGMVAVSFAPVAQADTTSSVQAQIQSLLAQVAALQAQLGTSTGASASVTFSRDLTVGAKGADVTALQNWLISNGYKLPAGATGYFGSQTKAAVAAWQAAAGISPAAGYFGPMSRAKANASAGTTTTTGGTTTTTGGTTTTTGPVTLTGSEATLANFNLIAGSGTLGQGLTNQNLGTAQFDVKNGDVDVQRVTFEVQASNNSLETHPWMYMKTAYLYDGSTLLAKADVSTISAWNSSASDSTHTASAANYYSITFTGFHDVVKAGSTQHMININVDAQNTIDSGNANQTFKMDIPTQGIRAVDPTGINQYTGNVGTLVTVAVSAAQNGKLTVSEAPTDPIAGLFVADPSNVTPNLTAFVFNVSNTQAVTSQVTALTFNVATTTATGSAAANITSIVRRAVLTMGGQTYTGTVNAANTITFTNMTANVPGNGQTTGTLTLDIFGQTSHFAATGESLTVSLPSTGVTAQNAQTGTNVGSSNISGTATGKQQTIAVTGGISVTGAASNNTTANAILTYNSQTPAKSFGTFTTTLNVTAIGQNIFVPKTVADIAPTGASTTYTGVTMNSGLNASTTSAITDTTSMTTTAASDNSLFYVIYAGQTQTFTITTTIQPSASTDVQVGATGVKFSTTDANLNSLQTLTLDPTNAQFHSPILHIQVT